MEAITPYIDLSILYYLIIFVDLPRIASAHPNKTQLNVFISTILFNFPTKLNTLILPINSENGCMAEQPNNKISTLLINITELINTMTRLFIKIFFCNHSNHQYNANDNNNGRNCNFKKCDATTKKFTRKEG